MTRWIDPTNRIILWVEKKTTYKIGRKNMGNVERRARKRNINIVSLIPVCWNVNQNRKMMD